MSTQPSAVQISGPIPHGNYNNCYVASLDGEVVAFARRTSRKEGGKAIYGYVVETPDSDGSGELYTLTEAKQQMLALGGAVEEAVSKVKENDKARAEREAAASAGREKLKKAEAEAERRAEEARKRSRGLKNGERRTDADGNPLFHLWDDFGMDKFAIGRKWEGERETFRRPRIGFNKTKVKAVSEILERKSHLMTADEALLLTEVVHSPLDERRLAGKEDATQIQLWHAERNRQRAEAYRAAIEAAKAGRPITRVEPGF